MSRDKMQAAFDEELGPMLEYYVAAGVPLPLLRTAFEIGYLAGECEQLKQLPSRVDRVLARASGVVVESYYTCNGSPKGCERERFGQCGYHDRQLSYAD